MSETTTHLALPFIMAAQAQKHVTMNEALRMAWDNTAQEVTTPAAGRFPIGVAIEAAGNGITSVAVRLDGIATAAA